MSIRTQTPTANPKTAGDSVLNRRDAMRMQTRRITVIAEDLRPPFDEGAKKTCFNLIRSLRKQGADLSIFTRYANPLLPEALPLPQNKLLLGNHFNQCLRAQSPHGILYIPSSSGTFGAFLRAAIIKMQAPAAPLALLSLQYRALPERARYLGLHRFVDVVFVQSRASAKTLQSFGCQTTLLPGGVDSTIFRPVEAEEKRRLRSQYGFSATDQIVLHVGHINRDRNVLALARVAQAGLRTVLVASTSTPVDSDLLLALRQAGVLVVTDFVEKIQHYYQMADCYLFPVFQTQSAIDAPLSVLEAMACNLPVVTTPFGALTSMFQPGNGLHFVAAEAEIVPAVKRALGEVGDCRTCEIVKPYSWDCTAATIFETFQGALR